MGLFHDRKTENGKTQVPVWFMRQAGRYHKHYQNIRKDHEFMSMCKNAALAEEITHGLFKILILMRPFFLVIFSSLLITSPWD